MAQDVGHRVIGGAVGALGSRAPWSRWSHAQRMRMVAPWCASSIIGCGTEPEACHHASGSVLRHEPGARTDAADPADDAPWCPGDGWPTFMNGRIGRFDDISMTSPEKRGAFACRNHAHRGYRRRAPVPWPWPGMLTGRSMHLHHICGKHHRSTVYYLVKRQSADLHNADRGLSLARSVPALSVTRPVGGETITELS